MEQRYCYGCMRPAVHGPICPHCGYDNRKQNAPHQLPSGTVLQGKYLIGKTLGQGGFGITYLGMDLALNMRIAIKEYYPIGMVMRESAHSLSVSLVTGAGDDRFNQNRARFLREAQTLARLENVPHVVQVRNFFSENNTAYIVMGYVEGITLIEYLRRNQKLPPDALFSLLQPVMKALDKVHALGLVHRDISPDNIMITPDGQAQLIDFGAAHESTVDNDKSTQAVLKHGYAPVEQYQRKGKLGPWTDVYAMCATIYRCLSQKQPPNATDRLMGEDDFDWDCIPSLTPWQKATLSRGVAPYAVHRIPSVSELEKLLLAPPPLASDPIPYTAPLTTEKPQKVQTMPNVSQKSKSRLPLLLASMGICGALLVAAVFLLQLPHPPAIPENNAATTISEHNTSATASDEPITVPGSSNILMSQSVDDVIDAGNLFVFRTNTRRNQIRSVTVLNSVKSAPADAVDASLLQDSSVLAWVVPNDFLYDLYLAAEGGIIAPEDCSGLFAGFSRLETVDFGNAFYTPSTTDMSDMFRDCPVLQEMDLSGLDTAKVTDVSRMFSGCTALTNLRGNFQGATVINYEDFMDPGDFYNGKPWKKLFLGDMVLMEHYGDYFQSPLSQAFRTNVVRHSVVSITFLATTEGAPADAVDASLAQDGSVLAWTVRNGSLYDLYLAAEGGVTAPADCSRLFHGFRRLREIHFNGAFDTSKVVNMTDLFYNCFALKELDLSGFDTGNVTNMQAMFANCNSLTSLDLSNFDTSRVTDMSSMFFNCSKLETLDVTNFNTSQVTNMNDMFMRTNKLKDLTANFDTRAVTSAMGFMDTWDTVNGQHWNSIFHFD